KSTMVIQTLIKEGTNKAIYEGEDNIRTFEYEYTSETFKHGDSSEMVLEDVKNQYIQI
ncbi:19150_t:CDS:2, partial [Gigaspora margarita]